MTAEAPRPGPGSVGPAGAWDGLAAELRSLRQRAGDPSYAEIARLVAQRRRADGMSEEASRVARTTVYDVFRPGRTRVNLALVREVAAALGGDDQDVDAWVARCRDVPPALPPSPEPPPPPARAPRRQQVVLLMLACVVVNLAGRALVDLLDLPVYLDMTGTAIAAVVLGPWRGATVGVATNLVGVASSGLVSVPFALVNVAGALVWGYGVRRWGMGGSLPRFFSLNLLVALACTLVAVPILVLVYGGSNGHGQDTLTATFVQLTDALAVSVGLSNVLTSAGDKMITGFVALVVISALPSALTRGLRVVDSRSPRG
ncbi:hypothetical protein [Nocardioides sp. cx-173]|uniref:hypothetical protein n=1 Tax=Nocardioides sp. cx-173 TaxID=2898796 RepID=UPI001E4E3F56|nr:hypothetical protein [Nocardioides sp. cx-173]MCD4526985.1 hypothetical protein [Nocardioides sp. cx-173]UGB41080.1 hypothetical protein LQ940_17125 [Nocardioides sp. cx-173]